MPTQELSEVSLKAIEQSQVSTEFARKMKCELNALMAFMIQKLDTTNDQSVSAIIRSYIRHYGEDLDEESLDED